jgi:hypothetical protein
MAIRIKEVAVQRLGPLPDFSMQFGDLNLIYGRNEAGKTYLVEFILRSVFREAREWSLRPAMGQGKVMLSGVQAEPTSFSADSRKKLEDYWAKGETGLPANMAALLVVKGAELALVKDQPGGISRAILKSYLSRDVVLDEILGRISLTLQKAQVVDGKVEGDQRGEIKARRECMERREHIEKLFREIEERYSGGRRRELELRRDELSAQAIRQDQAKRHLAYKLNQEIGRLEQQWRRLPEGELQRLRSGFDAYQRDLGRLAQREEQQRSLGKGSADYEWLVQAIGVWESRQLDRATRPGWALLVLGGILLAGGLIAAVANFNLLAVALILAGAALTAFHLRRLYQQLRLAPEADELRRLSEDFETRFGEKLLSLAGLKHREAALREPHFKAKALREECEKDRGSVEQQAAELAGQLRVLVGKDLPSDAWGNVVDRLEAAAKALNGKINELRVNLASLGLSEDTYLAAGPEAEFDPLQLQSIGAQLEETDRELRDIQTGLDNLKQSVCNETGGDISTSWPDVLEQLRLHRLEVVDEYKSLTAQVLAEIAVNVVLVDVRTHEDEKIRSGLKAPPVLASLEKITGRYRSLDMDGDQLVVSDPYGAYPLPSLSTGAQEQVLLAVRMGFASMLAGGQPLFLILDDAFQHSDWLRRERLVEEVVRLAKDGWQVTYLTMDEHLKGLFQTAGKKNFGGAFVFAEI